jgi:glycosyltransferase involved in cell wall biosynthesis
MATALRTSRIDSLPQPTLEVSIVMPCLDEAETLAACVSKAQSALRESGLAGEVIVADNGSSDGSQQIALDLGARVVPVSARGYGAALNGGISAAVGRYVVMADADDSYNFADVPRFVAKLRDGYDLVMGNRFRGGIAPGAMPFLHRYLGNPALTMIGRVIFGSPCGDFHCGMRGFSREAFERLALRTTGMEFASEMVLKATLLKMRIAEVPTTLAKDGRSRPPHLRTWRDGWRHLRFMLLYSPRWLFLYPGLLLMAVGLAVSTWLLPGPRMVNGVIIDVHTLLYAAVAILLGFQAVSLAIFAKMFGTSAGLLPADPRVERLARWINFETGLIAGGMLILGGLVGSGYAVHTWSARHFGPLEASVTLRMIVPAVLALTLGFQLILTSFFVSVLSMGRK